MSCSPGIYYENKGPALLYSMAWRIIVYVYLSKLDNETLALGQYIHHVEMCQMNIILNSTGCSHFSGDTRRRLSQLTKAEGLLKETTGQQTGSKMKRRGD